MLVHSIVLHPQRHLLFFDMPQVGSALLASFVVGNEKGLSNSPSQNETTNGSGLAAVNCALMMWAPSPLKKVSSSAVRLRHRASRLLRRGGGKGEYVVTSDEK